MCVRLLKVTHSFFKQQIQAEQQMSFICNKVLKHPVWSQVKASMFLWDIHINRRFSFGNLPALPPEIKRHIGLALLKSSQPDISNDLADALLSCNSDKLKALML